MDNWSEPPGEEGVEEEECDSDPAQDKDEGAIQVRGVALRVADVGKVGKNPEHQFHKADDHSPLGLGGIETFCLVCKPRPRSVLLNQGSGEPLDSYKNSKGST